MGRWTFIEDDQPKWKRLFKKNKGRTSNTVQDMLLLLSYLDEKGKDKKEKKDDKKSLHSFELGTLLFALTWFLGPFLLLIQLGYVLRIAEALKHVSP